MHPKSRWTSPRVVVEADLCRTVDDDSNEVGTIDPLAFSVLKLADGTRSPSAIAEALSISKAEVEDAFDRLRSLGLLDGWTAPPTSSSVVSRRRAVMDVGRAAAAFGAAVGTFAMFSSHDAFAKPKEKHYK